MFRLRNGRTFTTGHLFSPQLAPLNFFYLHKHGVDLNAVGTPPEFIQRYRAAFKCPFGSNYLIVDVMSLLLRHRWHEYRAVVSYAALLLPEEKGKAETD